MSEDIIGRQLNLDYLNYSNFNGVQLSENDSDNNISNLKSIIVNGEAQITFEDCPNTFWEENIIVKTEAFIPSTIYAGEVVAQYTEKNKYKQTPFVDTNIETNVLYCYRVFTKFSNSPDLYSGLKNIFFMYAYNINFDFSVITAEMILVDSNNRFVTDEQIEKWTNMDIQLTTYTKDEINSLVSENLITAEERTKLEMINLEGQDKYTVTQDEKNYWNNNENTTNKNKPNGYAGLDSTGKIDPQYIPLTNPWIAKGSETFNGTTGTTISIPTQSNLNYVAIIQPAGNDLNNPNGYLGEIYVEKGLNNFIVKNTGSTRTTFDYIVM